MMHYATITAKGQTTIPKEIRDKLKLKPGDKIGFLIDETGRAQLIVKNKTIDDISGMLHRPGVRAVTIEEMNEGIAEAVAEENDPRRWYDR